jgi:hypothetical protein
MPLRSNGGGLSVAHPSMPMQWNLLIFRAPNGILDMITSVLNP